LIDIQVVDFSVLHIVTVTLFCTVSNIQLAIGRKLIFSRAY